MTERIRCSDCVGDRKARCDSFYERYVELQTGMMGSFLTQAEELAPKFPGVNPLGPVLDTHGEFTEWAQRHSVRIAQEDIGCALGENVIKDNFKLVIIER